MLEFVKQSALTPRSGPLTRKLAGTCCYVIQGTLQIPSCHQRCNELNDKEGNDTAREEYCMDDGRVRGQESGDGRFSM